MNKITLSLTFILLPLLVHPQENKKEVNVVYGDHHIYTVETPTEWINNKKAAESIGLVNFFYHSNDATKSPRSYMYTMGYDKGSEEEDLISFVKADLDKYLQKYPDATYEEIKLGIEGDILNGLMISFDNLHDRFKEEVVYLETKETIIVFSFSALTKEDFEKYKDVFDNEFIFSFNYRGNNPNPFLEYMKNKEK